MPMASHSPMSIRVRQRTSPTKHRRKNDGPKRGSPKSARRINCRNSDFDYAAIAQLRGGDLFDRGWHSRPFTPLPFPHLVRDSPKPLEVVDSNGQTLAYVYGHPDSHAAGIANALTLDEARQYCEAARVGLAADMIGCACDIRRGVTTNGGMQTVEANMCADGGCLSTIDESDPALGRVERSREFLLRAIGKGHAPTPAARRGGSVHS